MDRTKTLAGLVVLRLAAAALDSGCGQAPRWCRVEEFYRAGIAGRDHGAADRAAAARQSGAASSTWEGRCWRIGRWSSGEIDLYPEYTGTALTAVLKQHPMQDPAEVLNAVSAFYRSEWKLDWLDPLGFDNTFAMIVNGTEARTNHLKTITDAAAAHPWRLGVGYEFAGRQDGLDGCFPAMASTWRPRPRRWIWGSLHGAAKQAGGYDRSQRDGWPDLQDGCHGACRTTSITFRHINAPLWYAKPRRRACRDYARHSRNYPAKSPMKKCAG